MEYLLKLSLVIPLYNEEESLTELFNAIQIVCLRQNISYEIIFVDDGSTDDSWSVLQKIAIDNPQIIKAIQFKKNYGKAIALNEGFKLVQGEVVITMDADLQDNPEEIPDLIKMIVEDGFHLVSGWKKIRYDNVFTKNIPSKFYNWVTRKLTKIKLHDFNCGLKAYQNKVVKNIELYGDMHRYIPVIANNEGYSKIGEKIVEHRARKYGVSKFGWERFINGFLDLLTIKFLDKFGKKPMHFFGLLGSFCFILGGMIIAELLVEKFFFQIFEMTKRPVFYFAILLCIIGMQLLLAGFIAELVVRNSNNKKIYSIKDKIGL